jgi:hypothetical protein
MKLAIHIHVGSRLKMSGVLPPLPHMSSWRTLGQVFLICGLYGNMGTSAGIQNKTWWERRTMSERNLFSGIVIHCEEIGVLQNNEYKHFGPCDDYSSTMTKREANF